jgi:hypothetical protein
MGAMEAVKDDEEIVSFQFDPKQMEKVIAVDPKTGIEKSGIFDPKSIVSVFFVESGTKLKIPPVNTDGIGAKTPSY